MAAAFAQHRPSAHPDATRSRAASTARRLVLFILLGCWLSPAAGVGAQPRDPEAASLLPGGWVDYAPSGMPDFSQCRVEWSRSADAPGAPPQWTHAGPVALAQVLWWLDSRAEPNAHPPSQPADGHALVTAYPVFGRPPDDHDPANLGPLVGELAARAGTDGLGRTERLRGTEWSELGTATRNYVNRRRLGELYPITTKLRPDGAWLAARAAEESGVILLLGMWELHEEQWRRVGGHYVAMAGASADGSRVFLADPLLDSAGAGGDGIAIPPDPARHSCRNAPTEHDDAAVVSYDAYDLFPPQGLPNGPTALAGFFTPATAHNAAAFAGQNPASHLAEFAGTWRNTTPIMALDAAIAITPRQAGSRGPRPTEDVEPTATPTEPPATATAIRSTPTPGSSATAEPSPGSTPGGFPSLPTVAPRPTSPWSGLEPVKPVGWAWLPIAVRELR